jgi:hypothetical protein
MSVAVASSEADSSTTADAANIDDEPPADAETDPALDTVAEPPLTDTPPPLTTSRPSLTTIDAMPAVSAVNVDEATLTTSLVTRTD